MKAPTFTSFFTLITFVSAAQNSNTTNLHLQTKLNLELQGVSISLEPALGKSFTTEFSGGIGTGGYTISENNFTYTVTPLDPTVFFSLTPKFYYNREHRLAKGKDGKLNAGNYFGLRIKYTSKGMSENAEAEDALLFNVHWGMQRALGKKWTMNTHFGVGYAMNATDLNHSTGIVYPSLDLKFSYVFNWRRA